MKKIVTEFVKYPFYANIIIAVVVLAGGLSLLSMKKSFFPERTANIITISVAYPGASPKEMEEGITTRIEEAVRSIVGIREITSSSSENFARVTIETTGQYDLQETLMEVKNAVDGISSFPSAAERPVVYKQRSITQALRMGLSGNVDLETLKKYATRIEDDFLRSGHISQISISGYPALEISVETLEDELMRYGITFDEISNAIALNNRDVSAGQIKSEKEEILIRSRNRKVDPDHISNIILRANNDGSFIRIRDIAEVKFKFADVSYSSLINSKQAVTFTVNKLPEEDLDAISEYCHQYVADFNSDNPSVHLEITFDYLDILYSRLDLLLNNGKIGLILVIISLGMFLSVRLSLWVAWGIPFSFLAMFIVAALSGITINMISLFGMILVIGILVDDGIVIAENIFSHFEEGKTPARAAIDGTMEVLPAVVTSISTTIVAFTPLLLLQGRMEFLYEMAFIVIFSLFFSLFEAFLVLPAHLSNPSILRRRPKSERKHIRDYLNAGIFFLRDRAYGKILRFIIKHKWIMATIPISLVLLTIGLFRGGFINTTFFPSVAFDTFNVDVAFTPGTGEKVTMKYLTNFEKAVWEVNNELRQEFNDTADFVTYTFTNLGNSFSGLEQGAHAGNITVILRDMEGAPTSSFEISNRVRQRIGNVPEALKFTVGGRNRWGSPVSISLLSRDLVALDSAKIFLMKKLQEFPDLKNITDNNAQGKQEIRLELKPKAYFLGINNATISNQVRQGFYGGQAQRLQLGKDEIRVWVRYPKNDRQSIGQLEDIKIKTPAGEFPLSELATFHKERGPVNIIRYNGMREVRVESELIDPDAPVPPILQKITAEIVPQIKTRYPGVEIEYQGQQKDSNRAMGELAQYFSVAFGIIVLILMIHFRNAGLALIIIMMIPLALLGSAWGHAIHGMSISMMSAWGMVALTGVIINDAVVFLAKYNLLLTQGNSVEQSVYKAGISRFRPILLTTITTTIGLFPLILEKSIQAQFLIPMAVALAYGVLIGTGFILIFFPVLILVLNRIKVFAKWLWTGEKPTPESVEIAIINSKIVIDD